MISNPDERQIEALVALEHNPNFKIVREWLEQDLLKTYQQCAEEHDITQLRQLQGAAKDVKALLEHAHNARSYLEKLRR